MSTNQGWDIEAALDKLGADFPRLNWDFSPDPDGSNNELISHWLGESDEEVMVNVFKGQRINEQFHRQDFFFIHIGQPYSGYAAKREGEDECIIIGILIKKETFIRDFLTSLSADLPMLNFFLEPHKNRFADEFALMDIPAESPIWPLLELIVLEYAHKTSDTQKVIKHLVMALSMYLSAEYKRQHQPKANTLADKIAAYIESHVDSATLQSTARHFGYHPVYISRLLPQKIGQTFSEVLLEKRMKRAKLLISHSELPIEKIAAMLGYSNSSNFYKAFREYYGTSPRQL